LRSTTKKAVVIRSSHGPENIQHLLRVDVFAQCSRTIPRICQRFLAAESPILSFLPQGQKVFVRTTGASCDVDNVSRLVLQAAVVMVAEKLLAKLRTCERAMKAACSTERSAAKYS